jgi:hypothetical protein
MSLSKSSLSHLMTRVARYDTAVSSSSLAHLARYEIIATCLWNRTRTSSGTGRAESLTSNSPSVPGVRAVPDAHELFSTSSVYPDIVTVTCPACLKVVNTMSR